MCPECLDSMRQLRKTSDVSREFNEVYKALTADAKQGDGWADILGNSSIRYRLFLCGFLQIFQQLVGIQILSTMGATVLATFGVHSISLGLFLSYFSCILGAYFGLRKIDMWGRFVFIVIVISVIELSFEPLNNVL
jgi:hypothetical protein